MIERINKHGIKVRVYETSHFGHTDKDGHWHNYVVEVPECCRSCKNLDDGEYDEYGGCWTPPSCSEGVWMPTKKGHCRKQDTWNKIIKGENMKEELQEEKDRKEKIAREKNTRNYYSDDEYISKYNGL